MVYIFEHPETGEFVEVFQAANDTHIYERDGIKWNRVWTVPHAGIDTMLDPFNQEKFVDKTYQGKSKLGDYWDMSKELSEKRKAKLGYDPIKQKHDAEMAKYKAPPPVKVKKS